MKARVYKSGKRNLWKSIVHIFSSVVLLSTLCVYTGSTVNARYYDPRIGRWITVDKALPDYLPNSNVKKDNLPGMGGLYNPININLYQYTSNNPIKYIDLDGNYTVSRLTLFNSSSKFRIGFYSSGERKLLAFYSYLPGGTSYSRFLREIDPITEYRYDSNLSDSSVAKSFALDLLGSTGKLGKWGNRALSWGGKLYNAHDIKSEYDMDEYRQTFLESAGLMDDKYITGKAKNLIKLMDNIDNDILAYKDKIEGTPKDKGFKEYAKSRENIYKNEIIPNIKKSK